MSRTTDINGIFVPELEDAPPDIEVAFSGFDSIDTLLPARFTTLSARNAAISSPAFGQMCSVSDTGELYMWNGSAWVSVKPRIVSTGSDFDRATSTLANVDETLFSVEADSAYLVKGWIRAISSTNANDLSIAWTMPAGATGVWSWMSNSEGITATVNNTINTTALSPTTPINGGVTSTSTSTPFWVKITTVGTAGTLQMQAAEATNTPGFSVTIQSRTWMECWKIA